MKLHDQSILLGEVLERQGSPAVRTALLSGRRELLRALHRCRSCAAHERCEAWLRSGARKGFGAFCPNASYVAHIMSLGPS
jgi:hypothetical protein